MRLLPLATLLVAFAALCGGCHQDDAQVDPAQDKAFQDQLATAAANHVEKPRQPRPDLAGLAKKIAESKKMDDKAAALAKQSGTQLGTPHDKTKADDGTSPAAGK